MYKSSHAWEDVKFYNYKLMEERRRFNLRQKGRKSLLLLGVLTLLMPCFGVPSLGNVNAQRVYFNFKLQNAGFDELMGKIKQHSDYEFVYKDNEVAEVKGLNKTFSRVDVEEILTECLQGSGLTFKIENNVILILKAQNQRTDDNKQKAIEVRGRVTDVNGEPLAGVTVIVKGTSFGVATNVNGEYVITTALPQTLTFSFIGMTSKDVVVDKQQIVNVVLEDEVTQLQDVVVTGVYERKKESYTGAAKTITSEELKRVGNQNLFQSLKNIDPSLNIMDNMAMGSDPNSLPEMQLRGTSTFPVEVGDSRLKGNYQNKPNQPLFILDGFETTIEKIFDMDMNRIATVVILKDAAAKALYGSKAANGVIVVETKRLATNGTRVTYTGSVDIEMPDLTSYDLSNTMDKLQIEKTEGLYTANRYDTQYDLTKLYNERYKTGLEGLNTYWLAKPLRTGIGHKHSLSVEMGDKGLQVFADFGYNDVQGVMKGSDREVISGDLTLSYRYKGLLFRNIMSVTSNHSKDSPYGTFDEYAQMNPYWRATDENGKILRFSGMDFNDKDVPNPLYNSTLNSKLESSYLEFTNNFYIEWTIVSSLKVMGRLGISSQRSDADEYYPSQHSSFANYSNDDFFRKGSYQINNGKSSRVSGDFNVNYNKAIGKHILFANARFNLSENNSREIYNIAEGFPSESMDNIMFARQYAKDSRPNGIENITREIGVAVSLGYNYDERYQLDANITPMASSAFGVDNRWANSWSFGLGWNLHKEKFMEGVTWLKQFRLTGTMGDTGTQQIGSNRPFSYSNYYLDKDYLGFIGSYVNNMENNGLKWQQKRDYNGGLDMLVEDLSVQFKYYTSFTENLVTNVSIPASTGFTAVSENLGKVKNKGIELELGYTFWLPKDGFISLHGAVATTDSKIIRISDAMRTYNRRQAELATDQETNSPVLQYEDGMPMDAIWAVPSLGIDPATGQEIYVNKDGTTTYEWKAENRIMAGVRTPKYNGNFGVNAEYKGFGVGTVFTFLGGGEMYNSTLVDKVENCDLNYNVDRRVLTGRWQTPGQNAEYKRLGTYVKSVINDEGNLLSETVQELTRATTRFVQKRNEMTFSSLNVYYDFKREWIKHAGMERLQLAFYMNNITTFSTIKIERGTAYPFARTMSFKLTATF